MKKQQERLRLFWGIGTGALLVFAGICLMAACFDIYRSGEGFSREAVKAAFSPIAVPVYLSLGAVMIGFVLHLLLPSEVKAKPTRQTAMALKRLAQKKDLNTCGPTLKADILAQRSARRMHTYITTVLTLAGSLAFFGAVLQPDSFHESQINESVIHAMMILLPCAAVPFGYGVFAAYFSKRSMEKEIELLKLAPNCAENSRQVPPAPKFNNILAIRLVLTCAAVALLVYGLATGGIADVLTKAINICTECVGLG